MTTSNATHGLNPTSYSLKSTNRWRLELTSDGWQCKRHIHVFLPVSGFQPKQKIGKNPAYIQVPKERGSSSFQRFWASSGCVREWLLLFPFPLIPMKSFLFPPLPVQNLIPIPIFSTVLFPFPPFQFLLPVITIFGILESLKCVYSHLTYTPLASSEPETWLLEKPTVHRRASPLGRNHIIRWLIEATRCEKLGFGLQTLYKPGSAPSVNRTHEAHK